MNMEGGLRREKTNFKSGTEDGKQDIDITDKFWASLPPCLHLSSRPDALEKISPFWRKFPQNHLLLLLLLLIFFNV